MNSDQNHIDELIAQSLAGETSQQQERELTDWLALSDENKRHYDALKKAFELGEKYLKESRNLSKIDLDNEWNRFLKNSGVDNDFKVRTINPEKKSGVNWLRIAAALLIVVASGFIINNLIADRTNVFETANATQEVILPDGSRITLNANSRLAYSKDFNGDSREVTLEGEGFFDVERNPQKPFVINAREARVEVLGTSFNVQAYNTQKQLEVVVQTGTVKVSVEEIKQTVTLEAGDRGVYARVNKTLLQSTNTDINFLAWKTKRIQFVETDLATVVKTLNSAYQANIIIETELPASCLITVTFDQQSLDAILNVLKNTLGLSYRVEQDRIIITHAGC